MTSERKGRGEKCPGEEVVQGKARAAKQEEKRRDRPDEEIERMFEALVSLLDEGWIARLRGEPRPGHRPAA